MPRATANVAVCRPVSASIPLTRDSATRLRTLLGVRSLPEGFHQRLETLVNACRQHALRQAPTDAQAALALKQIAEHAQALVHLLGGQGDAVAGALARLRREVPGGLDSVRQMQGGIEWLMWGAQRARNTPPAYDLNMSPRSAKVSMAAGIAELLDDYGIPQTTTTEPKLSIYMAVVKEALSYVGSGDLRDIPREGLQVWRDQVRGAVLWLLLVKERFCS